MSQTADSQSRPVGPFQGFGWGLAALCLGMIASVAAMGLFAPYYVKAASDMVSVYEGLLFNSKLSPDFLVYPGLVSRTLLGVWFQFLHTIGLLSIWRLEDLPPGSDLKTYEAAWQSLVQWGRVYSLLTGVVCMVAFTLLVRQWLGIWQIALLAGVAWAFSSGNALGLRILRPEMMTAAMVWCGLLLVLIAARGGRSWWRFAGLGLAGFLVAVAIIDKVQAVIPALAILPIALAFGPEAAEQTTRIKQLKWVPTLALGLVAVVALWPAMAILQQGIGQMALETAAAYKPLSGGMSGRYQVVVAAGIVVSMGAYGWIWRLTVAETLAGIAAVGLGLAAGFDLLYLQSNAAALTAVANPLEHLQANSAGDGSLLLSQTSGVIGATIVKAIGKALAIHTFIKPTHRPTLIIEWLAIVAAVVSNRRGERLHPLQIALLVGAAVGQDALFSLRDVKSYYLPYSDAPIILAGALAMTRYTNQLTVPRVERITFAVMALYIVWGHATLARAVVYGHHDRGKVCGIVTQFTKRITIPYCLPGAAVPTGQVD